MRYIIASTLGGALALAVTVTAQSQPPAPKAQTPPTTAAGVVTVEGCLMREDDVPGRKSNVAERAGIGEDYILTSVKMIKGTAPVGAGAAARPTDAPVGTSGAGAAMYEVEGIDDEKLKQHVGRRVQIEGTFENMDRAKATPEQRTPTDDLVEIRGTVIRQVSGECPPKP